MAVLVWRVFFPDIEPDQAQVQVLARGDLSARERDLLVRQTEQNISAVQGVQDFYARSFRPGWGSQSGTKRFGWDDPYSVY